MAWRAGSPPRARGRPISRRGAGQAGAHPRVRGDVRSTADRIRAAWGGAHPRVRGDVRDHQAAWAPMARGSPPRARGRPPPAFTRDSVERAHPRVRGDVVGGGTDAEGHPRVRGDVLWPLSLLDSVGAHPRVRGDVDAVQVGPDRCRGSPPRARGRLEPASRRPAGRSGAHPRVRGDVWRRPAVGDRNFLRSGLTPACAGTSIDSPGGAYTGTGSPPRARGRRRPTGGRPSSRGLTPACAGTSRARASPPRARGRPPSLRQDAGLTPACAGTS